LVAEVALAGEQLIADIQEARGREGQGFFWWLGQHSVVVKLGSAVLYIDPYLAPSPSRQTPALFSPEQVTNADLVLCTHDHGDHIDPYALAGIVRASPQAIFVAPRPHRRRMLEIGIPEDRLRLLSDGEELAAAGVTVTAVRAKHEFFHEGPEGFPFLGYVISGNGVCCYHSGDTLVYEGMVTTLRRWKLDAAFLPINGRDAVRYRSGCIGNMTYQEAVDLAGELDVGLAIAAHWDMFVSNSEDPAKFLDYLAAKYPGVPGWAGRAGERVPFGKRFSRE
jgi:L-ascorbate metabolism protein UlaG (beta-lactamase superfamily)